MRVAVTLSLTIDPEAWSLAYGTAPEEIRDDVREYIKTQVQGSAAAEEGGITEVTVR